MAELKVTIPDGKIQIVLDRFCEKNGYQETVASPDPANPSETIQVPNPQTKQAFVEEFLKSILRNWYIDNEVQTAVKAEEKSASQRAKTEVGF